MYATFIYSAIGMVLLLILCTCIKAICLSCELENDNKQGRQRTNSSASDQYKCCKL